MTRTIWHDVECGRYTADLALWLELAEGAERVLDVGAGTGRVALPLARAGHRVTALDVDAELLGELERRAGGLPVATLVADACAFVLPAPVDLVAVPMQTIQLLDDRAGFFASARRALVPGGRVAVAIATDLEPYDGTPPLPPPDRGEVDGWTYLSQPTAIRVDAEGARIERVRAKLGPRGEREEVGDVIRLRRVAPGGLAEEAAAHGLDAEELLHIPETLEHVASEVVVFRG